MNNSIADKPPGAALRLSGRVGYVVAVAAVAVATLVRLALDPALRDNYPFITYFGAVAVVAWVGRTWPAVVALALSGFVSLYLFLPPRFSIATTEPGELVGLALFLAVGGVMVTMGHAMRVARDRAELLLAEAVAQRDELQRAAEAVAEQKERLRTTLASIGDAVISTDRDGTVTYLNAVAEALTGWTNAESQGRPLDAVFRIVNESTRRPVENPAVRALKEGVIVGLANHTVLIARDGTERPIDDSAAPIRCRDGEIVGCVLVFRDISEKKRLEGERREAQERVVATLESITDAFSQFDREWRIVYVNSEAERLTGQHRSELLGRSHWDAFPTTVGTPLEAEYRRAVAARVTVEFEHYFPPLGRWFAVKGDPTPDGGLTVFFRDITDRKRAEDVLRRSEARFRRVFESNVVGMIRWDLDRSLILDANDEFLRMTGYTRDDVAAGRLNFRDMTPADWTARNEDGIRTIRAEGYAAPYEKEYFRKDGSRVPLIIAGTRFDDSPSEGMSLLIDISDRKRAEQEIARLAAESERQRRLYETVLTNTPDFIYVFSLDHKVLYANDALIKMWGRGQDGAIGKTFLEIGYEPWHAEMHDREIDTVRATKQPVRGEVPFDGTHGRREYDYIFVPVLGADGAVEAVAGTTRDVTERKETERRLRDGQEQLDFALAAADLGQWALNLTDHTARRTLRHDQIFGYDALLPEWTYETFLEHVVPDDRAAVDADFQKAVATGSAWAVECRIRRADGAVRHVWTKALIRRDAGGHVEWMLGIVGDVTDRRLAEEAERAGRERLRMALSAARMVAWEYDPATGAVVTSDNAADVYGFPSGEGMGTIDRGFAMLHPDDADRHKATVAAAVAAGAGFNSQFRIVRPDNGAVQWMEERGHAVRHGASGNVRLVGVNMDITARKEAEAALRESEERSAFVRHSTGVGFWYCDLPFDVLQWDELVKAHFHLPPDAVVTIQTFYDRLHPDDREPTRRAIERSIADRTAYNVDYRTVDPHTDALKWVRAIGRTFYAADGTPARFDGVTLDVTDQKRAELSLRESEERFRLMADAAPVMIWMSGTDKLVSWYNRPWLAFTGRSMEQAVGNGATEVVHPDDLGRTLPLYTAAFDARTPFSMEYRLRRHDGEYRWHICNGVPRYRADGAFEGYIGSCFDVTDYKNAQAALRDADRRKDEFLATLAHELRNPLAPIRNGLQVIRMAGANGTIEQARSMMERQLGQMVRLVDDLLDVSRVTTGKLTLSADRLELRAVIDAAVETSRPAVDQAGHALSVVIPDEPIVVEGDLTRLAQVVSNLLTNSAKYTHRGGNIRVSVGRDGDTAVVSVKDDGIGIPPAMLGRVFEMFVQVDRTLEKTTGGLGIGLSLVKGLVEMHGGTIEARSAGEGRGSEFEVRLPVAMPAAGGPGAANGRAEEVVTSSLRRILVVDDNVDSADSLGQLLEMLGNEVRTAYDGEAGIRVAAEFRPAVVLCDIGMPKVNGYDAARRIRAEPCGKSMVLVALTGWGQEDDRQKSTDAGFDFHLVKPVETAALMKLLAGLKTEPA
ncbi:PAS domain S-box protein [Frigoriglobus tundricola]|uniref:histidine kinase n=1 Tax=Frigoriglobus tundricola TaxID=2774151 RepID=A0A6M5YZ67_9BACT|nr:PAS domain S-box protein [Frigoriglobus tundricola]QJW98531.1 Autoinducer 2 sensor kinase/phosphatase LuxQ [Frigoriglobus tundricola]